jgi:hypothetical protein
MTQLDLFQPEAMSFEKTREDMPVRNLELKRTSSWFIKQISRAKKSVGDAPSWAHAEPRRVCCSGHLLGNGERSPFINGPKGLDAVR